MGKLRQTKKMAAGLMIGVAVFMLLKAAIADFYVYKENDGTVWYTDRKLSPEKYRLIAKIGRPTAISACHGVTSTIMERRAKNHMSTIKLFAKRYEVDHLMVKAIISVESCFDKYAVSRVGAKGLMQLMPGTADNMGVYNVFDAMDNIRGGTRYFSMMMKRFDQNSKLALAAYNAGPHAVEKYKGIPPYAETQKYVKRVLNYYKRYARSSS